MERINDNVPAMIFPGESFIFRRCSQCDKNKILYVEFPKRYYKKLKPNGKPRRIRYTFRAQCKQCYNKQRNFRYLMNKIKNFKRV